jgi:hypothetical protein
MLLLACAVICISITAYYASLRVFCGPGGRIPGLNDAADRIA